MEEAEDRPVRESGCLMIWPMWLTVIVVIFAVLLVLFCILAIACAGIFFYLNDAQMPEQASFLATEVTQLKVYEIETALQSYRLTIGNYPTTEQGLGALQQCPPDLADPDRWRGPYIEELPLDAWNRPYQYRLDDDDPMIWSIGPDGIDGTDDDIGNS